MITMNDNEFWIKLWKVLGTVLVLVAVTASGCEISRQHMRTQLVANGKDAIDVRCMESNSSDPVCMSWIRDKGAKK
jgi:hypothetical protein